MLLFLKQKRFFSIFELGYKSMLIPTKNNHMKIRTLSKNKINGKLHLNTKQVRIWINWKIVIIQYLFAPPTAPPLHMWKPIIIPLVKTSLQTLILIINLFHPIEQKLISLK